MGKLQLAWDSIKRLLSSDNIWTGIQTFSNAIINGGSGIFSPLSAQGPAIVSSGFVGTVTAAASTTVTFSSAADAVLAGYRATNPILGTTLISNALTRYIMSWTNSTTCVVDSAVTWAGTAITSTHFPISFESASDGTLKRATLASGNEYSAGIPGIGTTATTYRNSNGGADTPVAFMVSGYAGKYQAVDAGPSSQSWNFIQDNAAGGSNHIRFANINGIMTSTTAGLESGDLRFGTKGTGDTGPQDRVRILSTGNVGINKTDPAEKLDVLGNIKLSGTTGGFVRKVAEATSGALSGATGSIAVNVPSGARILGVQLRVDTLITSDTGVSWSAVYVNTPTTAICTGQAFTANTKFNAIHPAYEITTGTVTITLAPNAGVFTAGNVRAICYYEAIDAMASL